MKKMKVFVKQRSLDEIGDNLVQNRCKTVVILVKNVVFLLGTERIDQRAFWREMAASWE